MKFLHTSDLHLGKVVCGFSMLEEQRSALWQILEIVKEEQADTVFLCGDLYDRAVPPASAVLLLDRFLTELSELGIRVFAIAGNHDSGERIGFARKLLYDKGLFLEGLLEDGTIHYKDLEDKGETVRIHLLPFARPAQTRALYQVPVTTCEESVREQLRHTELLKGGRNILLAHHFIVDRGWIPEQSDSETRISAGGTDQVEAANFEGFDYVALGHLHGSQQVGTRPVYYSGSPVKYSGSEVFHQKSVILGEWEEDGALSLKKRNLKPIHDMRKIRGRLSELISPEVVNAADPEDYIMAVLTNEEELSDPIGVLRSVYPNVMQLQFERRNGERENRLNRSAEWKKKEPLALFESFYELVTDTVLTEEQKEAAAEVIEQAKGEWE